MVLSTSSMKSQNLVTFHVFTDMVEEVSQFQKKYPNFKVVLHPIPSFGWPEASLYRYKIIGACASKLSEDILMHLDADMLVVSFETSDLDSTNWKGGIALVAHPGFWRPEILQRIKLYTNYPGLLIRDFKMYLKNGGLGSWCTDAKSAAFVVRALRKNYVCGGTWFGTRKSFLRMVSELESSVNLDEGNQLMAKWHDESHLNKWASKNEYALLSPSFCYDPTYPQLKGLKEVIRAVDKSAT
jgi:hypothetical protein